MAGLSLDGLASGLPTTDLIKALMDVERIPQNMMRARVSTAQTLTTNLQALNKQFASLKEIAAKVALPTSLDTFKATSSSDTLTATAGTGATNGEVELVVKNVALKHSAVSAAMTGWPEDPAALTITKADGTRTEITPTTNSLDDIVKAVNGSEAGVSAMKVNAGTDADGQPLYRLQFTAADSGAAKAFDVQVGTAADVDAGTSTSLFSSPGASILKQGTDAEVTLYTGTASEQTIKSATNEFKELIPGVTVNVTAASTAPIKVSVSRDEAAAMKVASDLVNSVNETIGMIALKSGATKTTAADGRTITTLGSFGTDSTIRRLSDRTLEMATRPVDGRSPSEIGIEIVKDGSVKFNEEKFKTALADDPAYVAKTLQTIAGRLEEVADDASDKYDGVITGKITGNDSTIRNMNDQIARWDVRLASRESGLKAIYAALEVSMSRMNSQSSYLASQISSMPTFSNNKD